MRRMGDGSGDSPQVTMPGVADHLRRTTDVASPAISPRFFWIITICALLAALLVRLPYLKPFDFPLGEGGLFIRFSQLIIEHNFVLPSEFDYNGIHGAFAYPPAGFYLASAVSALTGSDLLATYAWLPITLNLLAIPIFCWFAAETSKDRIVFAIAVALYVQLPHSFLWQITGGGLPRSLAALFALAAVTLTIRAADRKSLVLAIASGAMTGFAILSHLEWGIFAAIGTATFLLSSTPIRRALMLLTAAGVTAAFVILPWLFAVVSHNGLAPFLSSSTASGWDGATFIYQLVSGHVFSILVWLAIPGIFYSISGRQAFLPLWTVLILLIVPRMGASAGLAIPTALLAGQGVKLGANYVERLLLSDPETPAWLAARMRDRRPVGLGIPAVAMLAFVSTILWSPLRANYADLSTLEQVDRASRYQMRWINDNVPAAARFVIISDADSWWADRIAEWFPLLANRESLTTAQGMEWAGPGRFVQRRQEVSALKVAQFAVPEFLPEWILRKRCDGDHIAIFLPPENRAREAFARSPSFVALHETRTGAVFRTRSPQTNCVPGKAGGLDPKSSPSD